MAPPTAPPTPWLPQSVFDALNAMDYDASLGAFKDAGGTRYYLFMCAKESGQYCEVEWCYDTDFGGAGWPRGTVDQQTFNAFKNGTYDASTQTISYNGKNYRIQAQNNSSHIGIAVCL